MRILLPIMAFIISVIGGISTLDWEDGASELARWCFTMLFGIVLVMFLSGCSTIKPLADACRDGLCR